MIVNKNKLTLDPSMNDQKWMNMVLNDEMYKVLNGPTLKTYVPELGYVNIVGN